MSEENNNELLEWYYRGDVGNYDVIASYMDKRGGGQSNRVVDTQRMRHGREPNSLEEPSTADMSSNPPESPQNDIQKEIERKSKENEQPTTADEVAYEDKKKIYRAYGMLEVLEGKLKEMYGMTNAYQNEPQRREQLAMDVKQITRELADLTGEL